MAKVYLVKLQVLIDGLALDRRLRDEIACKHFFSGAAAYTGGTIFMTLTPKGLALKLPPEDREFLMAQGAQPLRYFPKAPVKKDYVILPDHFVDDSAVLAHWVRASIGFVGG